MTRLIDADEVEYRAGGLINSPRSDGVVYTEYVTRDDIDNAPTIDAVEVVRCKDCDSYVEAAFWFDDENKRHECHICTAHSIEVQRYDFCSYGERRDNGALK